MSRPMHPEKKAQMLQVLHKYIEVPTTESMEVLARRAGVARKTLCYYVEQERKKLAGGVIPAHVRKIANGPWRNKA